MYVFFLKDPFIPSMPSSVPVNMDASLQMSVELNRIHLYVKQIFEVYFNFFNILQMALIIVDQSLLWAVHNGT